MNFKLTTRIYFRMISYLINASQPWAALCCRGGGSVIGISKQHWGTKALAILATGGWFFLRAGPFPEAAAFGQIQAGWGKRKGGMA
jgi:hypothetical protein